MEAPRCSRRSSTSPSVTLSNWWRQHVLIFSSSTFMRNPAIGTAGVQVLLTSCIGAQAQFVVRRIGSAAHHVELGEQRRIQENRSHRIDRSQLDTHAPTSISKTTNRGRAHVEEEKKRGQIMEAKVIFPKACMVDGDSDAERHERRRGARQRAARRPASSVTPTKPAHADDPRQGAR
jgi:hypothetical protein